ncbi:hypothetical protein ACSBR1_012472 [Camellia fascicularis]
MNDLFSGSFKKYKDLKHQIHVDDIKSGGGGIVNETIDLDRFFEDVEKVKDGMKDVERLYKNFQESNEESKTVHNVKTMKELRSRMDSDVSQVLKRVKVIKGKLEALERSNTAHRSIPGCGPGSFADRTRTSVVSGLGKKLKVMMDEFQTLRAKMTTEYKETVEMRYFTITREKANEELIENLISSGESETFLRKAIQEQGRGQILDTISEIQERHDAVKEIEKNLIELHQVFLDMAEIYLHCHRPWCLCPHPYSIPSFFFYFGSCIVETLDIFPVMENIFSGVLKNKKSFCFPRSFEHVSVLVNSIPFESAWPWMKGGCMKGSVSVMDEGASAIGGVMRGGGVVFGHGFQFRKFSSHGFLAMEGVLVIGGLGNGWFSMEARSSAAMGSQ